MSGKDIIVMNTKELKRLPIIHKVLEKNLLQVKAAEILGISDRQISRIVKRIREEGDTGIIHKSRGRPSNRMFSEELKKRVKQEASRTYNISIFIG